MKILFDFDTMASGGAQRAKYDIARAFARYNAPVATEGMPGGGGRSVEIDAKVRKTADIEYREVVVLMKDGQRVIFRVKRSGDIYQVLVNGIAVPITEQHDQTAAIREIVDHLNARRKQFQKRLAAVRVPMKRGSGITTKMQIKQLAAKEAGLVVMIEDARAELAEITKESDPVAAAQTMDSAAAEEGSAAEVAGQASEVAGDTPASDPVPEADPALDSAAVAAAADETFELAASGAASEEAQEAQLPIVEGVVETSAPEVIETPAEPAAADGL